MSGEKKPGVSESEAIFTDWPTMLKKLNPDGMAGMALRSYMPLTYVRTDTSLDMIAWVAPVFAPYASEPYAHKVAAFLSRRLKADVDLTVYVGCPTYEGAVVTTSKTVVSEPYTF
jgi:hypothetical protein